MVMVDRFVRERLLYLFGVQYPFFTKVREYKTLFDYLNFFIIIDPLWPPNPKEFDNA